MQVVKACAVVSLVLTGYAEALPTATGCPQSSCKVSTSSGLCCNSLADAVERVPSGGTVYVNGQVEVNKEIKVTKPLSFVGCGGNAAVYSTFSAIDGAIFRVSPGKVSFKNISFERKMGEYCSFLRTKELSDGTYPGTADYGALDLTITGCAISNFNTMARGGGAIFVGRGGTIDITNSEFNNNVARRHISGKIRWESGGGAVWIRHVTGNINVQSTAFKNNRHEYQHGNGGAILLDFVPSGATVTFGSGVMFAGNKAPGGGAVYIGELRGRLNTQATFNNNENIEGWGTRGGAMWIQNMDGATVDIKGSFVGNKAMQDSASSGNGLGRGGAIATNKIVGSTIKIKAVFRNNQSRGGGAVWDGLSGGQALGGGSSMVYDKGCVFSGNRGNGKDLVVRIQNASKGAIFLNEGGMSGTVTLK